MSAIPWASSLPQTQSILARMGVNPGPQLIDMIRNMEIYLLRTTGNPHTPFLAFSKYIQALHDRTLAVPSAPITALAVKSSNATVPSDHAASSKYFQVADANTFQDAEGHDGLNKVPALQPVSVKPKKVTAKKARVVEDFDPDGPIYDDCNDIRRKIRAHLAEGNKVTHLIKELNVNSNSYRNFMKVSGADSGQGNGIYPAAYYFFEKKRIAEGKPKSKKRLDNEDFLGYRGYSTDRPVQKWYVVKV